MTILITGATGTVGSQLTKQLDAAGQKVRVLTRDPKKAEALKGKNVEIVQGDLANPSSLDKAFAGVDAVFVLVSGSPDQVKQEKNAFDAAKKAGVKHVVNLSVAGANTQSPISLARWHAESEEALKSSGLNWTILQPMTFMQNMLANAGSIKGEGKFYGAVKNGRIPMIDAVDIAATAAAVLTKPQAHAGKTYFLTGPEALTQAQIAEKISKAIGKPVAYVDVPSSAFVESLKGFGLPEWLAKDFGTMHDWFATDAAASTVNTVEEITGRKPRTFDAFIADNAQAFK